MPGKGAFGYTMKSHKEQILSKCRHFNGVQNGVYRAGVKYEDVRSDVDGKRSWPCLFDDGVTCDKCEPYTEAEADARVAEAEAKARFERVGIARKAIIASIGKPWKKGEPSVSGKTDCPCCKKAQGLHYSRAGCNGHIHARCETEGCVCWME